MIQNFLNQQEVAAVNNAVAEAEKKTSGEIKILVVKSSADFLGKSADQRADARADYEFFDLGLDHTRDNTGILIMISLAERRVVVRASSTIDQFYDQSTWQTVVDVALKGIRNDDSASGICNAVQMCGEILSNHFPRQPDDVNEIPDEIVFKE